MREVGGDRRSSIKAGSHLDQQVGRSSVNDGTDRSEQRRPGLIMKAHDHRSGWERGHVVRLASTFLMPRVSDLTVGVLLVAHLVV